MTRSSGRGRRYSPPQNGHGTYVGYSEHDRAEVGILKTRVSGIEQDIHDLRETVQVGISGVNASIAGLGSKMEERGKVQWPAMSVGFAIVVAIGSLVYWPIREAQQRIVDTMDKVESRMITRTEVDLLFKMGGQRRDDIQRLTDAAIARVERDVAEVERRLVPRGEHDQMWAAQRQKDADLQRQIDTISKAFGDLYSPKDALSRLISRVDGLERELRARSGQPPLPPG